MYGWVLNAIACLSHPDRHDSYHDKATSLGGAMVEWLKPIQLSSRTVTEHLPSIHMGIGS